MCNAYIPTLETILWLFQQNIHVREATARFFTITFYTGHAANPYYRDKHWICSIAYEWWIRFIVLYYQLSYCILYERLVLSVETTMIQIEHPCMIPFEVSLLSSYILHILQSIKTLNIKTTMFLTDLRCVHAWSQFNAIYLVWILIKSLL